MPEIINIVEPTLTNEAGHCYSFVAALCKIGKGSQPICLWASRYAELQFSGSDIQVKKYFFRKIRRLQSYLLYRKLLAEPGKLFISTAGSIDLVIINLVSRREIPTDKVYLYFHWFNSGSNKLVYLKKLACKQPNLVILGPTPSVVKVFQDAGFNNVHIVPYPI